MNQYSRTYRTNAIALSWFDKDLSDNFVKITLSFTLVLVRIISTHDCSRWHMPKSLPTAGLFSATKRAPIDFSMHALTLTTRLCGPNFGQKAFTKALSLFSPLNRADALARHNGRLYTESGGKFSLLLKLKSGVELVVESLLQNGVVCSHLGGSSIVAGVLIHVIYKLDY
ncbi:hypothetical protein JTE90_011315 [Oedothorax gibbosus]|uniref:Uncharacterized protein n=1 Tax=Oedothorax gibbosus TaxID=931172 RepID=A0AAV6VML1_9ARAC|nr:hypothetical protein JTE90_011315 [Oedothorax gibbosus]